MGLARSGLADWDKPVPSGRADQTSLDAKDQREGAGENALTDRR
jgi:hypothetical protein